MRALARTISGPFPALHLRESPSDSPRPAPPGTLIYSITGRWSASPTLSLSFFGISAKEKVPPLDGRKSGPRLPVDVPVLPSLLPHLPNCTLKTSLEGLQGPQGACVRASRLFVPGREPRQLSGRLFPFPHAPRPQRQSSALQPSRG